MANSRIIELHQQWIGYLNPTGLVFSPNALEDAQVVINEGVISDQREFLDLVTTTENENIKFTGYENVKDIFLKTLGWRESDLNNNQELITQYSFSHPQFVEVVSPTYVAKVNNEKVILIQELDIEDLDKTANTEDAWNSSPHFKFERLLREKQTSTGIIVSKTNLRLIFAPRGESSGYIDFPFKIMYQPSGRLVFSAFQALFKSTRVFDSQVGESLIEILEKSRKYQAQVSIELSGQVLAALYELLRGFQTANDDENGKLLEKTLKENPQLIYEGLLTTLLRMVFIMYAEDRNLLATDEVYQSSYSLAGLCERLRQDEAQNPDTMDSRYGAWAHLISLFRLIYDGAEYDSEKGKVTLPARHGHLFDPNIYLFLEGRDSTDQPYNKAPKISDGVVFRVLKNLLVLNGERISYRTLDVEQIGSVYETMMGFEIGIAEGETIALKPAKSHGAPLPINLDEILATKDKAKKLGEVSELKLSDKVKKEFNECKTTDELESVLDKRIDRRATPFRLSKGAMVLVPSEARRKSGSHYTPRELTEPIVRVALEPILKNFGDKQTPEQILDLKICDPAMGSGAFLVEACRQLSEKLVESWATHKVKIAISADEDELLHARRLIAQKCLYGVDKNHMAVNLAKLSLWLVTLAKDHSFSFLDHNLKHGDSLVGLTNKQIAAFDYTDRNDLPLFQYVKEQLGEALEAREEIIHATDEQNYEALKEIEEEYLERLEPLRLVGNLALKCFFDGKNEKERAKNIQKHSLIISNYFAANDYEKLEEYCEDNLGAFSSRIVPFHWELEFPEVFTRNNSGFDCFVGNPPFLGGRRTTSELGEEYRDWLSISIEGSSSNSDLVAFFFRNTFKLLRSCGVIGFISTNTISQGDTRETGLKYILGCNGQIFNAIKRLKWPGDAAVVVSVLHLIKNNTSMVLTSQLNGKIVKRISAYLDTGEIDSSPYTLMANGEKSYQGCIPLGKAFVFDDSGEAETNSLQLMNKLIEDNEALKAYIKPYVGGDEVNNSIIADEYKRFIIHIPFQNEDDVRIKLPEFYSLLSGEHRKKRQKQKRAPLREKWWLFAETRPSLFKSIAHKESVLVTSQVSKYRFFEYQPANIVFDQRLIVFSFDSMAYFSALQSNVHEIWARFFGSTLEDRLSYTPTECFETFPLPHLNLSELEKIAQRYLSFRNQLKTKYQLGLTSLYNLFHDPEMHSSDIEQFRTLQVELDLAVISSFGWNDLNPQYDFILDYEDEEDSELSTGKKKKQYRFRFVNEFQEAVLAKLLKLNRERYEEEVQLGLQKR